MAATTELVIMFICFAIVGVEMTHTHACLQEEEEVCSIKETIASFL